MRFTKVQSSIKVRKCQHLHVWHMSLSLKYDIGIRHQSVSNASVHGLSRSVCVSQTTQTKTTLTLMSLELTEFTTLFILLIYNSNYGVGKAIERVGVTSALRAIAF